MSEMKITFKHPEEIREFVNMVSKYDFDIDVRRGRVVVDAKTWNYASWTEQCNGC